MYYPACPLNRQGRTCMKKLVERMEYNQNDGWYCETCEMNVEVPEWGYMLDIRIEDFTDGHYVKAFSSGEAILGISAKDLRVMEGTQALLKVVDKALYTTRLFVLKTSLDTWEGEERLKSIVLQSDSVDAVTETKVKRFIFGIREMESRN